jgi:hypothetical protein
LDSSACILDSKDWEEKRFDRFVNSWVRERERDCRDARGRDERPAGWFQGGERERASIGENDPNADLYFQRRKRRKKKKKLLMY